MSEPKDDAVPSEQSVVIELNVWKPMIQITPDMLYFDPIPTPVPSSEMVEFQAELTEDIELMVFGVSKPKIKFRRDGIRFHKAIARIGSR